MSEPLDTAALLALDAARTPGEWLHESAADSIAAYDETGRGLVAMSVDPKDAAAIVAAVNALGPLCRMVEELERCLGIAAANAANGAESLAAANARVARLEDRILAKRADEFWDKEDERSPEGF